MVGDSGHPSSGMKTQAVTIVDAVTLYIIKQDTNVDVVVVEEYLYGAIKPEVTMVTNGF